MAEPTADERGQPSPVEPRPSEAMRLVIASLAHRVRSALATVAFSLDTIRSELPRQSAAGRGSLETIEASCAQIRSVLESALGHLELEAVSPQTIETLDVLSGLSAMIYPILQEAGCDIDYDIAEGAERISGNPITIQEILARSILNAIERERPARLITLSAHPRSEDGRRLVEIAVRDDGSGTSAGFRLRVPAVHS